MYREQFPEPEQVVMVKVRRVESLGAYVSMLEYNNAEGMIMLSELSKRRIRSIKNLIRAGQIMAVAVIRVDQNKGYVDLSRRRVSHEEQTEMEEKFAKSKMVHSVMRNTSGQLKEPLEDLCEKISWPLYELYPHAYFFSSLNYYLTRPNHRSPIDSDVPTKPSIIAITACLAQSVERQALNLMVVGSSPTVGVFVFICG